MVRDLEKSMEISMRHDEENQRETADAQAAAAATTAESEAAGTEKATTARATSSTEPPSMDSLHVNDEKVSAATGSATSTPATQQRPKGVSTRLAITDSTAVTADSAEQEARDQAAGMTEEEKSLRQKEKKKGGLSKEQREELAAFEMERKKVRDDRVNSLAKKLIDRISLWTETDKGKDVTAAFKGKMELEVENLKMESFGLEILHAIGATYAQKSNTYIKSQKPVIGGVTGFFSRLKDKGTLVKETWGTVSTAISAQMEIEDMAKMEERGGEDWTDERKIEAERRVTGKSLAAAWRGSKFEIQSVLRDVCDKVLYDKTVKSDKRIERAHALQVIAEVFVAAKRSPDEEGDHLAFEQLMREAAEKKTTDKGKSGKDKDKKDKAAAAAAAGHNHHHHFGGHDKNEPEEEIKSS